MPFDPLALANQPSDSSGYERAILDALQTAIGFDAAFFACLGETPTTVALDATTLERAFAARTYDHELRPLKVAALGARGVAVDTEILGESEVRRRAYWRDLASSVSGRHSLMAYMILRGRPIGALMLGRSGSAFSATDVGLVESLLPRITLGRASFNAPFVGEPLPEVPEASMLTRARAWARGQRVLARVEREDGAVLVRDKNGYREMVALRGDAELVWSRAALGDPRQSGWFYVDLFHLAAARAHSRRRALFIGCGGAVAVRQFAEVYPGIAIDLVDIDPTVIELARDWYGLAGIPQLTVHVANGSDFVGHATSSTWDVIVVDAYDESDLPRPMTSRPFFRHVRRVLRPGGAMAVNVIGPLAGSSPVRAVERAARAELAHVRLVPVLDPDETYSSAAIRNVIVLGSA
jgi:spermidine synthase